MVPAKDNDGFLTNAGKVLANWGELLDLAGKLANVPSPVIPEGQAREGLNTASLDPAQMIELLTHVFTDLFQVGLTPKETLDNITRVKILLSAVMQGTSGLSTKARTEWWQRHTLPASLPVYSVATAMPDASTATYTSPLLNSPYFGADMFDYQRVLRAAYYSLARISGVPLNDSQVVTVKMRIYPSLITKYNPNQPPFPTHYLGIMGTHHWGHAFASVLDTAGGATNPFPRRAFAEALAAFMLAPNG